MVRRPSSSSSDIDGLKKGPWSSEEDKKLIEYVTKHGIERWKNVAKGAGLNRCGKSCRLRWTNYLRPDIKRGNFTSEEEEIIIQLHGTLGNKWSAIAARLPGRTDNEIKNYWNTHISKKLLSMGIDPVTQKPRMDLLDLYSILNNSNIINSQATTNLQSLPGILLQNPVNSNLINLINSLALSTQCNNQFFPQNLDSNLHIQTQFQPLINCDPQLSQAQFEQYFPIISANSTPSSQSSLPNPYQLIPSMAYNLDFVSIFND